MILRVGEGRVVRVEVTRRGGRHSFGVVWGCGLVLEGEWIWEGDRANA
jgi:hypothetical protein